MGKRANPRIVGAFVLGALALAIIAIIVLGSGKLFSESTDYVLFFNGNVNGLHVGAPVKFKGVTVGSVTQIQLSLNQIRAGASSGRARIRIPVIIELDQRRIVSHGGRDDLDDPRTVRELITEGLRAQLGTESLLTGLLYVDLDMHPGTAATMVGAPNGPYEEIPTLPTAFEQAQSLATDLITKLNQVDFNAVIASTTQTLNAIKELVNSPGLKSAVNSLGPASQNLNLTAAEMRKTVADLDARIGPLTQSLQHTSDNAALTLAQTRETLASAQTTLTSLQTMVAPESPLNYQMLKTMQDVSDAARSIRELADFIQRNPSALVRGKAIGRDQ